MWPKYLSSLTLVPNTLNTPNIVTFSPYELVFGGTPKVLLNLETTPDTKVAGTFKDYHELLNKRLKYLHELLQNFKLKRLAMINKDRAFLQYVVFIISPLMSQLHTASRKVMIKYVGPIVIYKIIDSYNYLHMTLDGKMLRGLYKHERPNQPY